MNSLSCEIGRLLGIVLQLFWLCMLAYAIASWIPSIQGRWTYYIARVVEPVVMPLRRIIPPAGGFDIAFVVVLLLVGYLISAIPRAACSIGYYSY